MEDSYGHQLPAAATKAADDVVILSGNTEGDRSYPASKMLTTQDHLLPEETDSKDIGSNTQEYRNQYISGQSRARNFTNKTVSEAGNGDNNITTIDLGKSNIFKISVSEDTQINFTNLAPGMYSIIVVQDENGSAITFAANVKKVGNIGTNPNEIHIVDVVCDGVNIYANIINDFRE